PLLEAVAVAHLEQAAVPDALVERDGVRVGIEDDAGAGRLLVLEAEIEVRLRRKAEEGAAGDVGADGLLRRVQAGADTAGETAAEQPPAGEVGDDAGID